MDREVWALLWVPLLALQWVPQSVRLSALRWGLQSVPRQWAQQAQSRWTPTCSPQAHRGLDQGRSTPPGHPLYRHRTLEWTRTLCPRARGPDLSTPPGHPLCPLQTLLWTRTQCPRVRGPGLDPGPGLGRATPTCSPRAHPGRSRRVTRRGCSPPRRPRPRSRRHPARPLVLRAPLLRCQVKRATSSSEIFFKGASLGSWNLVGKVSSGFGTLP